MNAYSGADAPAKSPQLRTAMGWSPQSWPSSTWRLFWKEFRQILPLLWALLAIGALLQIIGAIQSAINPSIANTGLHQIALVLMPSLFSVGAGAMLVSQEKELRTLQWLSSLPIPTKQIVWTKFLCGLVGLILCWVGSCVIAFAFCPNVFDDRTNFYLFYAASVWGTQYFTNSLFLLVASMTTGWIFKSAWVALVMMVPIAIVPVFTLAAMANYREEWFRSTVASLIVYSASAVVLALAGRYWGRSSFVSASSAWFGQFTYRAPTRLRQLTIPNDWRPLPAAPSLLWQIGWQNRMLWVSAVSILLGGLSLLSVEWFARSSVAGFVAIPSFIIFCWLGASTFGSDGDKKRIQFLADRGVSPGLIWWTRQFFPLCLVTIYFALFVLAAFAVSFSPRGAVPIPVFIFLGGIFAIFGATQWASQLVRSSLLNMCVAPAVGVGVLAAMAFAFTTLGAGYIWLVPSVLTLFVASRVMMRSWMDSRFDLRTYLQHAGFAGLACLFPVIPFVATIVTYPSISTEAQQELAAIASRTPVVRANGSIASNRNPLASLDEMEDLEQTDPQNVSSKKSITIDFGARLDTELTKLASYFSTPGFYPDISIPNSLSILRRTSIALSSELTEDRKAIETNRYQRAMALCLEIAKNYRQRTDLLSQEFADQVEMELIRELSDPQKRSLLESQFVSSMLQQLGDKKTRQEARLKALAVSWNQASVNPMKLRRRSDGTMITDPMRLGGISVPMGDAMPLLSAEIIRRRRVGLGVEKLYRFLKSGDRSSSNPDFRAYREFWHHGYRDVPSYNFSFLYPPFIGDQWFGPWENSAEALAKEIQETLP
ncbi:ABC transporter permease [Pirellulaceae bacterium SH501]